MPPKRFTQEHGVLIPPQGTLKNFISWSLENVLEGFKQFFNEHGRYPIDDGDLKKCPYLPTSRSIQRHFGGMIKIREMLGLDVTDYTKGESRSKMATMIGERGFELEELVYRQLVARFHEPFVHYEARIVLKSPKSLNVDFLIFHKTDKFAVDVFYPDNDRVRFSNNTAMKFKTYKNFPFRIYLCIGNQEITPDFIEENVRSAKKQRNPNAVLIGYKDFLDEIGKYEPLNDPYCQAAE